MTAIFAWICAAVAALATLGAAYFFDKSAEEGIVKAEEHAAHANSLAGEAHERAAALEKEAARAKADLAATQAEIEKSKLALPRFGLNAAPTGPRRSLSVAKPWLCAQLCGLFPQVRVSAM